MKKITFALLLAIILIPVKQTFADDDDKQFYKGIRVGWQNSNISNSEMGDLSSFYAGFFGVKRIGAGKLLSMYSGLEFYQIGAQENSDNKVVLSYISIPVNLRLKVGPVYAFGGFNPSFKVGSKITSGGADMTDAFTAVNKINTFDIGGQLGIGAKFLFVGAELKYNLGFLDVYDNSIKSTTTEHLQLGLCLYF